MLELAEYFHLGGSMKANLLGKTTLCFEVRKGIKKPLQTAGFKNGRLYSNPKHSVALAG